MAEERVPVLHEQYADLAVQEHAARLGMWVFLATEVLLFAGLFGLYASYRNLYRAGFIAAAGHNDAFYGTLNTVVLISSSFTVAWGIHATRSGRPRVTPWMLVATLVLALVFLVVKTIEYRAHFHEGLYPGIYFDAPALDSYGARMFFTLYYFMTGLHALHVLIGMGLLGWLLARTLRAPFSPEHHVALEVGGLYWHLVDLIWIFLWPLLYLVR